MSEAAISKFDKRDQSDRDAFFSCATIRVRRESFKHARHIDAVKDELMPIL